MTASLQVMLLTATSGVEIAATCNTSEIHLKAIQI